MITPPQRQQPVAAMQRLVEPEAPVVISQLPPAEQGRSAADLYAGMAEFAGQCRRSRDVLIRWIKGS